MVFGFHSAFGRENDNVVSQFVSISLDPSNLNAYLGSPNNSPKARLAS